MFAIFALLAAASAQAVPRAPTDDICILLGWQDEAPQAAAGHRCRTRPGHRVPGRAAAPPCCRRIDRAAMT